MAAYLLSLQRLASLRRRRLREGLACGGSSAPVSRAENGPFVKEPSSVLAPSESPKQAAEYSVGQEFLDIPKDREQIEAWLRTRGGSEAAVLRAVFSRLASLEARLSELEGTASGGKSLATVSLSATVDLASNRVPVKSDLLEQVFQKNLSLRKMG